MHSSDQKPFTFWVEENNADWLKRAAEPSISQFIRDLIANARFGRVRLDRKAAIEQRAARAPGAILPRRITVALPSNDIEWLRKVAHPAGAGAAIRALLAKRISGSR